jgi:hypothetical protein
MSEADDNDLAALRKAPPRKAGGNTVKSRAKLEKMGQGLTELDRLKGWSFTWRACVAAVAGACTAMQFVRAFDISYPSGGWFALLGFAMVGMISWLTPGLIALIIQRHREDLRR